MGINTGKWALVTGASSGFGVDFARELAAQGHHLILVARRVEPMQALAAELSARHGVRTLVVGMDLGVAGVGAALKERLDGEGIEIDLLIDNAGYGVYGDFVDQALANTLAMLQLNILALTELSYAFGRAMARRGNGRILLVSSIGGYQATPTYAAYSASKAYVLLFGEALHEELRSAGVTVTVLAPGIASTDFLRVSGQQATFYQRTSMMGSLAVVKIGLAALARFHRAGLAERAYGLGQSPHAPFGAAQGGPPIDAAALVSTILVLGGSGLVGAQILALALADPALAGLGFASLCHVRPALLDGGPRPQTRPAESVGLCFVRLLAPVLPLRYHAVSTRAVASTMLEAALQARAGLRIIESEQIAH